MASLTFMRGINGHIWSFTDHVLHDMTSYIIVFIIVLCWQNKFQMIYFLILYILMHINAKETIQEERMTDVLWYC